MPETKQEGIMLAIGNVQQNIGSVLKESKGQVGNKIYKYAGLNEIWTALLPLLKTNSLVVTQTVSAGDTGMQHLFKTTIFHTKSNEQLTETMPFILSKNDPQGVGSAITYYRRYMLSSMFGLVTDEDNDAQDHRLATAEQKQRLVGAVKLIFPDVQTPDQIIKTIMEIVGKHPSNIREDEADKYLELIKSFSAKAVTEE